MKKLKQAIQKGQALRATEEVVDEAMVFLQRLEGELILTRAIASVPAVKLPPPNTAPEDIPAGYYQDKVDIGHIKETDEYPFPPADGTGYVWEHSLAYSQLQSAIEQLKSGFHLSESTCANPQLIADAKTKLVRAEKDFRILDGKDQAVNKLLLMLQLSW